MIRTATGLNEARDASTPDANALVGLQKLAALNSNTATRHILDASLYIYRSISEALTYRVADILEYSDFKEDFVNKIGKYNVSILGDISELYIYDFGIFIEVAPDEEQRAQLEQNIQMALSKGDINLEDAIDIRELRNLKLANQLLKLKRKQKQDRAEQMQMQVQAMNAQQALKSQEMASQLAMQKQQADIQGKMQLKQAEIAFDIEKQKAEAQLKSQLMAEEFNYSMQIQGMTQAQLDSREVSRDESKSKRISQQNSEQSKLINQRKNNLPPVKFESNEDSLDGFDLAEFSPR
jgi:predicted phage tail protein